MNAVCCALGEFVKRTLLTSFIVAIVTISGGVCPAPIQGQEQATQISQRVDFGKRLRDWDGFGVTYVETHQTRDFTKHEEDYGGLSLLSPEKRQEVLALIFGGNGLKPSLIKMFLDPFHEGNTEADKGKFDHITTARWMNYFAKEGLALTRKRGDNLTIIGTLYGPPAWMTKQRFVRGRDLDPARMPDLGEYMISWVKYLRNSEGLPVKYISPHNEGESATRWDPEGKTPGSITSDHNMWWPPEQVVDFIKVVRPMLDKQALGDVGVACGETSSWVHFNSYGYPKAIMGDAEALHSLGLVTSHGFGQNYESEGTDVIEKMRPDLHSWTTSSTWGKMDAEFVDNIRGQIYEDHINGYIPWAVIQRPGEWIGNDPNPGTAINVHEDGTYTLEPGYYLYKQVSRVGQAGMAIADVSSPTDGVGLMGFAANGTRNPDAFVVINKSAVEKHISIQVEGSAAHSFSAIRSIPGEMYSGAGEFRIESGAVDYVAPAQSVTTFVGRYARLSHTTGGAHEAVHN